MQAENEVVKTWGQPREEEKLHNHVAMVQMLDIADLESGTAVAGASPAVVSRCETGWG